MQTLRSAPVIKKKAHIAVNLFKAVENTGIVSTGVKYKRPTLL
jgi:hypothetical protein